MTTVRTDKATCFAKALEQAYRFKPEPLTFKKNNNFIRIADVTADGSLRIFERGVLSHSEALRLRDWLTETFE